MLQKVRKRIMKKALIKVMVCIAIILGTLVITDMGPVKLVKGPEQIDIDNINLEDNTGKYVKVKITYVYDYFLEEETYKEYKNGSRSEGEITARYYISDVNLSQYLALLADGSVLMDELDVLMDNTRVALENGSDPAASTYRGTFVKLSDDEYSELNSFMTQVGVTEDMYSDYVFKINYIGKIDESVAFLACCMIVFAALYAVLSLIRSLNGRYLKDMKKFAVDNGIIYEQLCMELDKAYESSNIWITSRYTAYIKNNKIRILKNEDYIWAYYKETKTTRRNITTTKRQIALADRNKRMIYVSVASEEAARDILGAYSETQPHMVLGFNEDLQNLFNDNFDQFVMLPYQKTTGNEETASSTEYIPEEYIKDEYIKEEYIKEEYIKDEYKKEEYIKDEYKKEEYIREGYVPEDYIPETYVTPNESNDNNNIN